MAAGLVIEGFNLFRAGQPGQFRRCGKEIGGMGGAGVLPAMLAMAQKEPLELSVDFEGYVAAEA